MPDEFEFYMAPTLRTINTASDSPTMFKIIALSTTLKQPTNLTLALILLYVYPTVFYIVTKQLQHQFYRKQC